MDMEGNADRASRPRTSRAAAERAAEYGMDRADAEKRLSDRYIAVQQRLSELEMNKERGAKAAIGSEDPKLEDLAILLRNATITEMKTLTAEKEELEGKMREKGMDPDQYAVSAHAPEVLQ